MKPNKIRVLIYDIETTYVLARVWRTGEQYINHDQIVDGDKTSIICIGYKWYGEPTTHCLVWDKNQDSEKMIDAFTKIVEQADLVVAHNGDKFDTKHLNTQRLIQGKSPINWPSSEDTLKQIRRIFALPSYRLDYISKLLTGSGKKEMSFRDWVEIKENKSAKHLAKMVSYCKVDVRKLEEVYRKVERFLVPKINAGLIVHGTKDACPRCSSRNNQKAGFRFSKTSKKQRVVCNDCGTSYIVGPNLLKPLKKA